MTFKDKTFCASPNCENKCGRQMTKREEIELKNADTNTLISYGYFCGGEPMTHDDYINQAAEEF